jgi:hypothetical protein
MKTNPFHFGKHFIVVEVVKFIGAILIEQVGYENLEKLKLNWFLLLPPIIPLTA